ncbi:SRPBCC family protein [Gordonia humi]|uniref:Uncharacterized protein YndB with AHSA1/START domain n=1 Tax=Gordonia humi TaxID=686429 RepID=A0A840EVT5_9ACTN|nr:SRPBCC family protein [Gordonia humi]MBB4133946.1 uncharacterized protein YndB with AHSA1/START domain [Gordonia humi]
MTAAYEELIEETCDVDAAPALVWGLINDPRRMSEWSPQVDSVRLRGGTEELGPGTEFSNLNHEGGLTWATHGTIVRFESEREMAFRIRENAAVWSFRLEPIPGGGTHITQQRQTPGGLSSYSLELTESHFGGQERFTQTLRAGMRQTLARIKAAAEDAER